MSDATRAVALSEAIKLAGFDANSGTNASPEQVLAVALSFDNFLNAVGETAAPVVSAAGKEPTKATTAGQGKKPAAAKKPAVSEDEVVRKALDAQRAEAAAADAAADETESAALTHDDVQAVIAKSLAANKRPEIVKLLKKYGATSATSVKKADITKFVTEAQAILPAEETSEDVDLTA